MIVEWGNAYEFSSQENNPRPNWALEELAEELVRLKVDVNPRLLGVADAFPDGGWCIHKEDNVWLVYHSERGRRSRPSLFTSPFDAANFYLWIHVCHPKGENTSVGELPRMR